jgi:tetratricopeptide (TPR) repeat protein
MVRDLKPAILSLAVCALALAGLSSVPALAAPPMVLAQYFESLGDEPEDGDDLDADEPGLAVPGIDQPNLNLPDLDGAESVEPQLRPDAKLNEDGSTPPQSAEETKQNKLDLELGEVPLAKPLDRPKMLAQLYEELSAARNAYSAEPIMKAIEELWSVSGSDTVDLLMSRAAQFANESEVDLSLDILDAVVDIAPLEAEPWYLRAKVNVLKGKPERALADLRRALNLDAKHYRAINDLGLVLEQLGAKKEALEAYRRALAVNPFLEDAQAGVEALKREVEGQDI